MYPYILEINNFRIESYSLFLGLAIGAFFLHFKENKFLKLNLLGLLFVFIGAKILFLITSKQESSFHFWTSLGGQVFFGGLIAALIYLLLMWKIKKINEDYFNQFVPGMIAAHAIGRIGCFLTACCYGKIFFEFLPIQIVESFFLLIIYFFVKSFKGLQKLKIYLLSYAIIRFVLEFFREDQIRGLYKIAGITISASQIISIIILLITLFWPVKSSREHKEEI